MDPDAVRFRLLVRRGVLVAEGLDLPLTRTARTMRVLRRTVEEAVLAETGHRRPLTFLIGAPDPKTTVQTAKAASKA